MKYSYINPRKKSVVTPEVQLMMTFFTITVVMLFSTYSFLLYKNYSFAKDKIAEQNNIAMIKKSLTKMEDEISYIKKQKNLAEKVYTQNTVLKDSISNLFDLVPSRITLSEAKLLKNGLILHGITPSKDIYNFMLHAPLRSIFHRTYSSFYPTKNGWLRFVSTNYIDDEELSIED
jgi:hypothetical protein